MASNNSNTPFCKICKDFGKDEETCKSHWPREFPGGPVCCPTFLNEAECAYCHEIGDHLISQCPKLKEKNDRLAAKDRERKKFERQRNSTQKTFTPRAVSIAKNPYEIPANAPKPRKIQYGEKKYDRAENFPRLNDSKPKQVSNMNFLAAANSPATQQMVSNELEETKAKMAEMQKMMEQMQFMMQNNTPTPTSPLATPSIEDPPLPTPTPHLEIDIEANANKDAWDDDEE